MPAIVIPTNYSWSHLGRFGSRGPSVLNFATAVAEDFLAMQARCDTAMQVKLDACITQQTAIRTAVDVLVGDYNGHIASSGSHIAADVDNPIASPVATDITVDILALVNDEAAMYIAHVAQGAAIHPGGADAVNALTATNPATTEAEAFALANDVKAMYELHRANNGGAWHTNPDATNTIVEADATDWDSLPTLLNGYKNTTGFNAHIVLTAGPVHGATGVVDLITAADCGVQITALWLEVNEFQTDYNAHAAHLGVHPTAGVPDATAAATTEATTVALLNAVGTALNTHMASADDHLDADATTTPVAGTATEYEDVIAVVAEFRAAHVAHLAQGPALHHQVDGTNTGVAVGAGGDVPVLGAGGVVTINTVMGTVAT